MNNYGFKNYQFASLQIIMIVTRKGEPNLR